MDVVFPDPGPWWHLSPMKDIILWLKIYPFDYFSLNRGTLLILGISVIFLVLYLLQMWTDVYYSLYLRWIGAFLTILVVFLFYCGVIPLWLVIMSSIIYFAPIFMYIVSFQI